ncbi:ectoine synthase [Marinobacter lutaoensis]|jgi:L-ectoine synthase|uniref:L-ectoine synthase n=1 Tax=Marinobacter lutaoensis TaxID=135739 RepID=A0A1V2DUW1_9GAMM|nr:ectoine synthase [Marinobacter lutaoensis]MBE02027.1 ectoine synthase [Marinobacter sp.]MBI43952.1 ectoine synthase [Oceanospirillales bacterium]NVD34279.1 ectoine synthase [Marinobacter lutaoensis]ONF44428.1 L-ectoine synthase [Marinobacter lutaoensis]|tara:strand:- start:2454 stop:2849 length:396 start_codon:yes stop_codon:yes gene_type:complete
MKIVRVQDIIGTEREVEGPGWTSRRLLLKKDGMGFSFHETIIPAGSENTFWYKHHLEAVYCVSGNGSITDLATGETHEITDGTLYALDKHDKHILRGGTEDMRLICAFNPPVTGREVHDEDGAYMPDPDND